MDHVPAGSAVSARPYRMDLRTVSDQSTRTRGPHNCASVASAYTSGTPAYTCVLNVSLKSRLCTSCYFPRDQLVTNKSGKRKIETRTGGQTKGRTCIQATAARYRVEELMCIRQATYERTETCMLMHAWSQPGGRQVHAQRRRAGRAIQPAGRAARGGTIRWRCQEGDKGGREQKRGTNTAPPIGKRRSQATTTTHACMLASHDHVALRCDCCVMHAWQRHRRSVGVGEKEVVAAQQPCIRSADPCTQRLATGAGRCVRAWLPRHTALGSSCSLQGACRGWGRACSRPSASSRAAPAYLWWPCRLGRIRHGFSSQKFSQKYNL